VGLPPSPSTGELDTPVRWIRGPFSDCCWFFSGVPLGMAFASGTVPPPAIVHGLIALNTAHLFAPVAMTWSHRDFRQIMLAQKRKFIVAPILLLGLGPSLACAAWHSGIVPEINVMTLARRYANPADAFRCPLEPLIAAYFVWNIYHFAMQNYGLLRIYRPSMDTTMAMRVMAFATVMLMVVIPDSYRVPWLSLFMLGAVVFNHQLAALGLAAHIWANHHHRSQLWFVGPLLLLGALAAWGMALIPSVWLLWLIIGGVRITLGFGHFLYDRWVYTFSDPRVRDTIGKDLLRRAAATSAF
jgi:hypothetical protein